MTEDLERIPIGNYDLLPLDKVAFGPGAVGALPTEIDRLTCHRAFLVADEFLADSPALESVRAVLDSRLIGEFVGARENVSADSVVRCVDALEKARADVVVTVGSSGAIDTTKAAIRAAARDTGEFYPHVALPTAASGQEFSPDFMVTDDKTGVVSGAVNPFVTPRVVILDVDLTAATPDNIWLAGAAQAVENAVEMVTAPNSQPATDASALEAIRLLTKHLNGSVAADQRQDARQQCLIAGWLSLFGAANITLGLSHALSRDIAPRYKLRRGEVAAVVLPKVMAFLLPATEQRQMLVARAAGIEARGRAETEIALEAAAAVEGLLGSVGLPTSLRELGVPEDDLPELAGNREDILKVLREAW